MGDVTHSSEDKRRALDRVLESRTFERADQLRRFLQYICEEAIAGREDQISEFSIATEALGRPKSYIPGEDSTVRGRAHDLRTRLDRFYESEGRNEDLRIEIHKGSYAPRFVHRAAGPCVAEHEPDAQPPVKKHAKPWFSVAWSAALVVTAAGLAFYAGVRSGQFRQIDPVLREFWGPLLDREGSVLICLATPPSLVLRLFQSPPPSSIFSPAPPDIAAWSRQQMSDGGQAYMLRVRTSPLIGDMHAALKAASVLSAAGVAIRVVPEVTTAAPALRDQNLVVIGAPNYSPYARRVLRGAPFAIRPTDSGDEIVSGAPPGSDPRRVFGATRDQNGDLLITYGLLTVFQSGPPDRPGHRTVLVSGIAAAGAQAAMELFADPGGLRALEARMRSDGHKSLPNAFQVVVRCSAAESQLLNWEVADYAVLEHQPLLSEEAAARRGAGSDDEVPEGSGIPASR